MDLCLIWAQDRHRAIGRSGHVPWRLPEDKQHFKQTTLGSPVIMGRRTWESLRVRPLPGRLNIVLSRTHAAEHFGGASRVAHLNDALAMAGTARSAQVFVIGGAEVFAKAMPVAQRLYVTEVDMEVPDADAFAPEISSLRWTRTWTGPVLTSAGGLRYQRTEYRAVRRAG